MSGPADKPFQRPRVVEKTLLYVLGAAAVAVVFTYVVGLVYLLVRGGWRIVTFTAYPTPEQGIQGETFVRAIIAAAFGGCLGAFALYVAGAVAWVTGRIAPDAGARLQALLSGRNARAVPLLFGVLAAVAVRNHLPRFIISLPSETQAGGGIGPELFNTLYFAALSTAATTPIGIGAALYLARFSRSKLFTTSLRVALDTLASLPSIVYGLFGFLVFVVAMKAGYSLVAGAAVLSILNLPLVVGIAEESIRAVPRELEDASLALGATRVQTVLRISLPYAWPGILGAIVLSIGRVFAESAPLIMTAGTTISRSTAYSFDPMRGGETLAVHLWYVNSAGLAPDRADVSAGTAAVLVILVAVTNFFASRLAAFGGATGGRLKKAVRLVQKG